MNSLRIMPKPNFTPAMNIPMDTVDEAAVRQYEPPPPKKTTSLIILGCGILQLPIWGFPMTFGIFEAAYSDQQLIQGSTSATGIIGTTMNGVMYLSMPFLATALQTGRWASWRRSVAIAGICISSASFLLSSWSTQVWHLIVLQGVVAAFGNAMLYVPTTLWLDEWFRDGNRATAYGVQYSCKNVVGTGGPFLMHAVLQNLGFRNALRVWSAIAFIVGLGGLAIVPLPPASDSTRTRKIPWTFLKHRSFYVYSIANVIFSSGYGLPQTYLSTYASQVLHLSGTVSALTIATFNAPGIISSTGFGLLTDKLHISAAANTLCSTLGSALCVFLLWGLKSHTIPALLIAFSIGYGFFASGYSATWAGWIKELEREAAEHNEALNSGMLYGLLNGARGIGYVAGGLSGVELLKVGPVQHGQTWAWGTKYGALILFTGLSAVLGGGWSALWRGCRRRVPREPVRR